MLPTLKRWTALFCMVTPGLMPLALAQDKGAVDTAALVRRASQNELRSDKLHMYRFRLRKADEKTITTKEIVETKDGDIARLLLRNDKPLSDEDQKAELARLEDLRKNPSQQAKKHQRQQQDNDRASKMVRLLPDAFLYTFIGMTESPSGPAYKLAFKPNPNFNPPDREAEVFHGMAGELWIDKAQERMVKLDAHLIEDVNFGWGILGKLFKGGSILVEQADVGEHHWETTHMKLNLTGKALMLKSLSFHTTEDASDFQPVPAQISYQEAIQLLVSAKTTAQLAKR